MLRPDARVERPRHLVSIRMRRNGRAWIIAEVTVDIDDAGRHPFARRVDHRRAFGNREVAAADRLDPPVRQPDRATVAAPALALETGRAPDPRDVRQRTIGRAACQERVCQYV